MRIEQRVAIGLLLLVGLPEWGRADLIISHTGDANPTTENFGVWPFNGTTATAALPNDLGVAAWQIANSGSSDEQSYYNQLGGTGPFDAGGSGLTLAQISAIDTNGFVMSLDARVVSGPTFDPTDTGLMSVDSSVAGFSGSRFSIELGSDGAGNTVVVLPATFTFNGIVFSSTAFDSPLVIPGNGYHLYQLSYDPATAKANLFVDGIERITGYGGASVSGGATANNFGLAFGATDDATDNFARVELDSGQITPTAVPEPATLSLVAFLAMAALVGFSQHRNRHRF